MPGLSESRLPEFRRALRGWYRRARREMPWRGTRDAYRIWLSEVMLQQTRVAAVVPYYRRFLRRFPTLRALARARSEAVLQRWAGLGYYSRARNLHRAAKEIVARHNGRFPRRLEDALALPGIGRYTAAAVLSMAYDTPLAVLDGNVARVLARLDAVRGDLCAPSRWGRLEQRAQALLDTRAAGEFNQAMMELGATLCTSRAPRCAECPVARWCRARRLGIAEQLPAKRSKPATVEVELAAAVLLDPRGRTLLVRPRHDATNGFFSRLWQFPALRVRRNARGELARLLSEELGLKRVKLEPLPEARHGVTHHAITLRPFLVRVASLPSAVGTTPLLKRLNRLAVSSATRKIAAAAAPRAHP